VLVDHAPGTAQSEVLARLAATVPRRIVLVTPAMRPELAALKEAGFTSYLIRPVRATSLAARFAADDAFEPAAPEPKKAPSEVRTDGSLSILVAEDNERALLTKLGHHPTMAADGVAAVESFLAARAAARPTIGCSWTCTCRAWTASRPRAASEPSKPSRRRRARRSSR
jgi:hypothetical protein